MCRDYHYFLEHSKKKSWKVLSKNLEMIFWNLNFSNFSKVNPKTDFISQLHVFKLLFGSKIKDLSGQYLLRYEVSKKSF